jgi:hypothetical protein
MCRASPLHFRRHFAFLKMNTLRRRSKQIVKAIHTLKLHSYPVRNGLDTLRPQSLVQFWVQSDIGSLHLGLGELDDGLDGPRSPLLEGSSVDVFVEVDGVLAGHDILEGGAAFLATRLKFRPSTLQYTTTQPISYLFFAGGLQAKSVQRR